MSSLVPSAWMPNVPVAAIVCHWTGGAYPCSNLDRAHYHIIVDGDGKLHRGAHSIAANVPPLGGYAAHTRSFNAKDGKAVIGVAVTGMAGATQVPFRPGQYPIKREQIDVQARVVAELCDRYGLPVTPRTVLQHGEVQANLGIAQRGKWDVCKWPFDLALTPGQVCVMFRAQVQRHLDELRAPASTVAPPAPTEPPQAKSPRLLMYVPGLKLPAILRTGTLENGVWYVDGSELQTVLSYTARKPGQLKGRSTLRAHLQSAGLGIDEAGTQKGNHLSDEDNPRQYIFLKVAP